jgi:hypothetical protein
MEQGVGRDQHHYVYCVESDQMASQKTSRSSKHFFPTPRISRL